MVDGFLGEGGFSEENMDLKKGKKLGYYLHLHGSPLFINRGKSIIKQRRSSIRSTTPTHHLVLTHVKHKPTVIDNSRVLREYWIRLSSALNESEELLLIGYSGEDEHLNNLIRTYTKFLPVQVIEWENAGKKDDRYIFWRSKLGTDKVELVQMKNILEFSSWG